jgi:hypothetical protein
MQAFWSQYHFTGIRRAEVQNVASLSDSKRVLLNVWGVVVPTTRLQEGRREEIKGQRFKTWSIDFSESNRGRGVNSVALRTLHYNKDRGINSLALRGSREEEDVWFLGEWILEPLGGTPTNQTTQWNRDVY